MIDNDHLSSEVSVVAEIKESRLSASAKSRAIAAVDRLIGGVIDIPAACLEDIAATKRIKSSVKQSLIKAEGNAAEAKLINDPAFGDRIIERMYKDQSRKQNNLNAVAQEAIELLRIAAPEDEIDNPEDLDEDWLNTFDRFAQDASSDRLRKLWGRVLAGEIRRPKSFSLTTLRFMSELDVEIARIFENIISIRSSDGFILKPKKMEGQQLLDLTFLEEVGLLHGVNGVLNITLTPNNNNEISYRDLDLVLEIKLEGKNTLEIPVIKITRIGKEIATILPKSNNRAFMEQVAEKFINKSEFIELHSIIIIEQKERKIAESIMIQKWK